MKSKQQRQKEARQRRVRDYWYWYHLSFSEIVNLMTFKEQLSLGVESFKQSKMRSAERDIENLNSKLGTVGLT